MRTLPAGLQAHLDGGTTTLCHCWRLTLKSGERLGFTDHDVALSFDATIFEAQAGFTGSEIESSLGLSVDNLEATGALNSGQLDETRLRRGDFDHATVEIWKVNWQDVSQRILPRKGHLGEVTTASGGFAAEVRGLAGLLAQPRGRVYQYGCDASLGDARCGAALATPAFRRTATVTAVEEAGLRMASLGFADGWLTRGEVKFLMGVRAGETFEVKRHQAHATHDHITLWQALTPPPAVGDTVQVTAGCDKQLATCISKFSNAVNFRGFPHMPGTGFVASVAHAGDATNNGGKRG
jgi:uncharacterized phage protein (TIGR02218 family)